MDLNTELLHMGLAEDAARMILEAVPGTKAYWNPMPLEIRIETQEEWVASIKVTKDWRVAELYVNNKYLPGPQPLPNNTPKPLPKPKRWCSLFRRKRNG